MPNQVSKVIIICPFLVLHNNKARMLKDVVAFVRSTHVYPHPYPHGPFGPNGNMDKCRQWDRRNSFSP